MAKDVEIFVRDCPTSVATEWAASVMGEFRLIDKPIESQSIFHGCYHGQVIRLVITERMEGGAFTSIWLNSVYTPWESDVECARSAFAALRREVRCDPGDLGSKPQQWYRIEEGKEGLVEALGRGAS